MSGSQGARGYGSASTDSLLQTESTGSGYGLINGKRTRRVRANSGPERWHVVAFCALTACIASMVAGMSLSFPSIIINELDVVTEKEEWKIASNGTEASLIGGLMPIGAIFGGFLAWPVADYLGRQAALMIGGVPGLIGWLIISLSSLFSSRTGFLAMVYVGRILTGVNTGWSVYCVSVYIGEISSTKYRGLFGNCNQLFITIGLLISYVLGIEFKGKRLKFYEVALVAAGLVALFEVMMLFTFETPRWLFTKKKDKQGTDVLKSLRGPQAEIEQETADIKASLKQTYSVKDQLKEFRLRSVYQPFLLALGLMFFQQFSGINAATFYSSTIFTDAGFEGNMVEIVAAVAAGLPAVIATFVSVLLIDRLGRRVLLMIASAGMMLSAILLAIYFALYKRVYRCDRLSKSDLLTGVNVCSNSFNYMAFVGVVVFISSFNIGWGPIPWTAMSELLPNKVRGLAGSVAAAVNWAGATVIGLGFVHYKEAVHDDFAWASFALVMFVSIICVFLFLPETKGHSLEEIQENFEHGQIFAVRDWECRRGGDRGH